MYAAAIAHLKILLRAMLQTNSNSSRDSSVAEGRADEWMEPWVSSRIRHTLSSREPGEDMGRLWAEGAGRTRGAVLRHAVVISDVCKRDGGMNDLELLHTIQSFFAATLNSSQGRYAAAALDRMGLDIALEVVQACSAEGSELARSVKRGMAQAVLALDLDTDTPPQLLAQLLGVYAREVCSLSESTDVKKEPGVTSDVILSIKVVQKVVRLFVALQAGDGTHLSSMDGFTSSLNLAIRAASSLSGIQLPAGSGIDIEQLMKDLNGFSS
jgi:hypothetical protein